MSRFPKSPSYAELGETKPVKRGRNDCEKCKKSSGALIKKGNKYYRKECL